MKSSMPVYAPGSLSDEQVYALLAFELHASGIALGKKIEPAYASTIRLH